MCTFVNGRLNSALGTRRMEQRFHANTIPLLLRGLCSFFRRGRGEEEKEEEEEEEEEEKERKKEEENGDDREGG